MCQDPGRVFKGKKMAGHMGAVTRTTQNLEVIRVDENRNLIMIKGAVPGSAGSNVTIKPAVKTRRLIMDIKLVDNKGKASTKSESI